MEPTPTKAVWNDQLLNNPHAVADKRARVQQMFAAIAPAYDLNNRLHSFWRDQAWRRAAVRLANLKPDDVVVDVACGTGDLTLAFGAALHRLAPRLGGQFQDASSNAKPPAAGPLNARVVGVDFTFEMLPRAAGKDEALRSRIDDASDEVRWAGTTRWINGDATALPLPDACCDVVSIAFGIRNVQEPQKALGEFRRILKPGGRVIVLEFSEPTNPLLRAMNRFYTGKVMPITATLVSGDKSGAYKYLPKSIGTFWTREKMSQMLSEAGFESITQHPMTFGVCVCYRGVVGG